MSRDLLIESSKETATESPAQEKAKARQLVDDLLATVQREWSTARPRTESLWQLAGE